MSRASSECQRCKLYQTEVALLRAETESLRESVLALSDRASVSPAVLDIIGMHQPQRLAIRRSATAADHLVYDVLLTYRDTLSARCDVPIENPVAFLQFFEDLASHAGGWDGEKSVANAEGQLQITCAYDRDLHQPEIRMDVSCALDDPSFDPYWMVRQHLDINPGDLAQIAAQAKQAFG